MVVLSFMFRRDDLALNHIKGKVKLDKAFVNPVKKVKMFSDRVIFLVFADDFVVPRFSGIMLLIMLLSGLVSFFLHNSIGVFATGLLNVVAGLLFFVFIVETLVRTPRFNYLILKKAIKKCGYKQEMKQLNLNECLNAFFLDIKPKFKKEKEV